ncbi:MAG: sodium:solute symporter [Ktedonobacteraceae bacterium]|nr:sodium:solute symporter [Ktedonobacteraceae bacterium]
MNWQMIGVFTLFFLAVTTLGFWAARWRPGDLNRLQEWGLAGRRFGSLVSWFLIGGDMYTAYTFMAVPALIFAQGAQGFFAIPSFTLMYPIALVFMPRFWTIARHRGYLTSADFVRERFDSKTLALLVAVTGILATMPYVAVQIYGMQLVLAQMGVPVELALFIAFLLLAAYTYISGLRGPALIAMVKDISIWIITLVAIISLSTRLGGFERIFAVVPQRQVLLAPEQYSTYATLILGSALPLFLYPHALTGVLSTNSRKVVKRTAAFLLAYTLLQGLLGLLGFVAIAAGVQSSSMYQTNAALPALLAGMFPSWFVGFAFSAIAIGALVPAGIMSIGAAHLFTRSIYREYFRPTCTEREESNVAKTVSLFVKAGALAFVLFFPTTFAINLQLFGNVWMLQTLPAVFLGLYTRWFHRLALIIGWAAGMLTGTWMVVTQNFMSVYPLSFGGITIPVYAALAAVIVNLLVCLMLTPIFRALGIAAGQDMTSPADYEPQPVAGFERPVQSGAHWPGAQLQPQVQRVEVVPSGRGYIPAVPAAPSPLPPAPTPATQQSNLQGQPLPSPSPEPGARVLRKTRMI